MTKRDDAAGTRREIVADDVLKIRVPLDPQVSSDGKRVVFCVRGVGGCGRPYTNLVLGELESGAHRGFTMGPWSDTSPRFSPDGRWVAFLTTRPRPGEAPPAAGMQRTRIAVIPTDGGEARLLTDVDAQFDGLTWTPDSRGLVFAMRVPDPVPSGEARPLTIRVTRLRYKLNGSGYLPADRFHLHSLGIAGKQSPQRLTDGDWDDTDPSVSPDGCWIAFLSNRRDDRELDPDNHDVWVVPSTGGPVHQVSRLRGEAHGAAWSSDSRLLAFVQTPGARGNFLKDNAHVFVAPSDGSAAEWDLTPTLDRCTLNLTMSDTIGLEHMAIRPAFGPGDRTVLFPISDSGRTLLARVPVVPHGTTPGLIERFSLQGTVAAMQQTASDGPIAVLSISHTSPGRVLVLGPDATTPLFEHDPNRDWLDEVTVRAPEPCSATPPGAVPIQGWLLRPPGPGPHPLLLYIHGGPVLQYGDAFFHELQWLCAQGFAVLFGNPRGSQGYGHDFTWAIHKDWGTKPFIDLMALVDAALARGGLDETRMGVLGGSYGGYMTLWTIGHTNRFRAACAQRTVSDMEAMIWSDFGGFMGDEVGAFPWEDPELYRRLSPLTHAQNMHTPLLLTQGLDDMRTPPDQAERAFVTLKRLGRPVEMVLFPGADHDLSRKGRPQQRVARLDVIGGWMRRHLMA